MKKIFTFVAAVAAAVCANAAELTFDVALDGTTLTVTPSDNETEYYYYAVPANVMAMWNGFIMPGCASDPDRLFSVAVGMCESPYTGVATDQLAEGEYTFVAAPVTADGTNWKAAGAASMKQITVGATVDPTPGDEPGNVDFDVTFTLASDGTSFTITPSNDDATYYYWVFSEADKAEAAEQGMTLEEAIPFFALYAMEDEIHQGACTDTADNWYIDEEGKYFVVVLPVRYDAEEDVYVAAGEVAVLDWTYTTAPADDPVSISKLQSARVAPKAMQAGRVVLQGRYNLNGTLAR